MISRLFDAHPEWRISPCTDDRFIRADSERNYRSARFIQCIGSFGYRLEPTPPRDKHANGVAERTVGTVASKCNLVMLAPTPHVPQTYWDLAMSYVCTTLAFNYHSKIGTSPYNLLTDAHVNCKLLRAFWTKCWVFIPPGDRKTKIGSPRAYKARFVGYDFHTTLEPTYRVIEVTSRGTYGIPRISKDVIFDDNIDFKSIADESPLESAFENLQIRDLAQASSSQLPNSQTPTSTITPLPAPNNSYVPLKPSRTAHPVHSSTPVSDSHGDPPGFNAHTANIENDDAVYWYSIHVPNFEYKLSLMETERYQNLITPPISPNVPKSFWKAMATTDWAKAIDTELTKFEANDCFHIVPHTNQHLVPMMWVFTIKNDGTKKARLVGRGDKMIPTVDFDPDAVYCGNVSACSIKIALTIAAKYKLEMRGGDLVGAYLITRANPDFPVHIVTPQGYEVPPGFCIQAVGNLYGFPPAGQNFSIEFDKCLHEAGYKNTPWDLKFFYKWTPHGEIMIIIAHSDDFRWFGPQSHITEWDSVKSIFNSHGYEVTDATDKEFVGIRIQHDADHTYYMDQHRMIDSIIKEANLTGAKDEHLPYPTEAQQPPLSKLDNASTPEETARCAKFEYRKFVGKLMYGMVHTLVTIMYALNVISRYGNAPGDRHILFLRHLLKYVKYARNDRLKFESHPGPYDKVTMTNILQLHFQCDADLGGNKDNMHSQTAFLGYLGGCLICWCSTDQGSISTSTAESEIKAVNHTLKAEVISCRGILNTMGWTQEPTKIEEDNQAAVFYSKNPQMTRNLRHLDITETWIKSKVLDGTCFLHKVPSADNNSDIGTKRVPLPIFTKLTSQIIDRSLRNNL